jgi:lipopolysaccharide export LptBFGC system permease protein LptF
MLLLLFLFLVCLYIVFVSIVYFIMRKVDTRKSVRKAVVLILLSLPFVDKACD